MALIWYFGRSEQVTIGRDVGSLGRGSFFQSRLTSIAFEEGSVLTQIGDLAFSGCSSLKSICIPAGVESLGKRCFSECTWLTDITFAPFSRLSQIGSRAFQNLPFLKSICIPEHVQNIPKFCFAFCGSLTELRFEPRSKVATIHARALRKCRSLIAMDVPAELEVFESVLLRHCWALPRLAFQLPSRLKRLELGRGGFESVAIPDSVEVLMAFPLSRPGKECQFEFGAESHLTEMDLRAHKRWPQRDVWFARRDDDSPSADRDYYWNDWIAITHPTAFVRLHEATLRRFRCAFEGL
jgi:hypothetical protein